MIRGLSRDRVRTVYDRSSWRYDLYHWFVTLGADQRGRRQIVERGVREGDRVLDAGGGTGSTALLAAEKAGPSGHVTLFDLSAGMVEVAHKRAQEAGLADRMTFCTGSMLELPFDDGAFDCVLSTYSLCPLYDPSQGALELYRCVRPGGRLASAHSAEPRNAMMRWIADVVIRLLWFFPSLTLGCRPVSVLPALEQAGARTVWTRQFGVWLWPFFAFIVERPEGGTAG